MKHLRLYLLLAVICAAAGGSAWAAKPAPMSWQKYKIWNYGDSPSWTLTGANGVTLRRFIANHYAMSMGTPSSALARIDSLQAINSQMKFFFYDQIYLAAGDTVNVKAWAAAHGYSSDSMFIRATDTIICRVTGNSGEGFEWFRTTLPGGIVLYSGYTDAQTRFAWDFRNPHIGEYLAYRYDSVADAYGIEGVMIDEECPTFRTGIGSGIRPRVYPFADNTTTYHQRGYNAITRPWNTGALTHNQIMDSLMKLKWKTYDSMGAYLAAYGKIPLPNWAGYGSPWNTLNNWDTEVRHASVKAKGMVAGEYCVFDPSQNPSGGDFNLYLTNCMVACYGIRDSGVVMSVSWIKTGYTDVSSGNEMTLQRSHMNFLGTTLAMEFSGSSQYYFAPCDNNGQVYYNDSHSALGETTHSDTVSFWAEAWGKYFGDPINTRDTAQTGTDGAGQTYKILKVARIKPSTPSDTLIFAVGRFPKTNSSINDIKLSTTSVTVTLPTSKTWCRLNDDGTWTGPITSTSIGNAEWEVFSSDTVLSNNGITSVPSATSIFLDSLHNDYTSNTDSGLARVVTPNVSQNDSLIIDTSSVSFAALDSTVAIASGGIRKLWPNNTTDTTKFIFTLTETGTLYIAAWAKDTGVYSTRVQVSRLYTAASTPSVTSLLVDSVFNDAIGELDTLQTRVTANASIIAGDSLIAVYSLVGFASCDSSSNANSIRRAVVTAGVTYTDKFALTNSETYTLYCAAWHWNATTGWSTRVQQSRTYTAAGSPPVTNGQLIKWIRKS